MKTIILLILLSVPAFVLNAQVNLEDRFSTEKLMREGFISVTIGGDFIVNGSFPALISERVDQFVTRVYNEAREEALRRALQPAQLPSILEEINRFVFRGITLKRISGEEIKVDLLKFRMTGDFSNNPFLRNDDVIIFPSASIETNYFTLGGMVNRPGRFYYMENDRLSDAIELAGGIDRAYERIDRIEIHRLNKAGTAYDVTNVTLENNPSLLRGDRILVIADPEEKRGFSVTVLGEVKIPGKIPVTKSLTSIKEVIERAGGLKESAALNRARLFSGNSFSLLLERRYGVDLEVGYYDKELNEFLLSTEHSLFYRMSNVTEEDSLYFIVENEIRSLMGGTSIDFTELNNPESQVSNYNVNDGDLIIIPEKLNKIYVFGQVNNPGYVVMESGRDYEYYLKKAGGLGEFAEGDRTMIIKANSFAWYSPESGVTLEDGDYIFVPREPARSFNFYLQRVTNYLTIAGSIATIVLLLVQLTK